jgi:hypothetical protein
MDGDKRLHEIKGGEAMSDNNWSLLPHVKNKQIYCISITPIHENHNRTELECKCKPKIEIENGVIIITHNSFFGLEAIEEAERIIGEKE